MECSVSLYADDTAMFSKCQVELMLTLQMELDMVAEWIKANRLTLNVNKTKYVIFGN